ncbi:MAG: tRNA (adenosine(37)-N6)-threonylcarbamoyltransferase complex ATPase subunit type 1 TsaE [Planctomycetota bacterium]|nr:tRNA (adenosine(37)-N6)-threonylcarbamoyltransferase complex ATPase subunit type 1 TsaE [Planctomycetota bacterium]
MKEFLASLSAAKLSIDVASAEQLEECAQRLAPMLRGGDFVGLVGDLGAGKTTWCRGLGVGLNATTPLRSPSYLLMHEVEADIPILHIDAYFEHRLDSLLADGDCERFTEDVLLLVEWANHVSHWWPKNGLYLGLEHNSEGTRTLSVHSMGPRGAELAEQYSQSLKNLISFEPLDD